jgi:cytochrome P450
LAHRPFARKPISSARLGSNIVLLSDPDHIRQAAKLEKEGKLSRQSFTHAIAAPILDEDIFTCPESEWRQHRLSLARALRPTESHLEFWRSCARRSAAKALETLQTDQVDGWQFCRRIAQDVLLSILLGRAEEEDFELFRYARRMDVCAEWATFFLLVFGRKLGGMLAWPFQRRGAWIGRQLQEHLNRVQVAQGAVGSDPELRPEIRSLLFAGQETLSVALCLFFWLMATHPEYQEELRSEKSPKRLNQLILETLRLFPPTHTLPPRTALEPVVIGGVEIPKGTEIIYSVWYAHRRPDRPNEFVPERFADKKGLRRLLAFGVGPKRCVGEHLAMSVLPEIAQVVLERVRIECHQPLKLGNRTTLRPNGLVFRLHSTNPKPINLARSAAPGRLSCRHVP